MGGAAGARLKRHWSGVWSHFTARLELAAAELTTQAVPQYLTLVVAVTPHGEVSAG